MAGRLPQLQLDPRSGLASASQTATRVLRKRTWHLYQVLATVLNWRASRPIWLGQAGPVTSRLLEKIGAKVFMDAHQPVTLEEGDRYPLVPPSHALVAQW